MTSKIGLVGSGYMATEYLKASTVVENLEIVSIYSRNANTAASLASHFNVSNIAQTVEDFACLDLDFIIVCVPELSTAVIIASLFKLNVPLLVEKPVGLTLADALAIESQAKAMGVPVYAALNRRFYKSSLNVFGEISKISDKRFVQVIDQENTIAAKAAGQPQLVIENWMFANSIHIIDFITTVCRGEPNILSTSRTLLSESAFVINSQIAFSSGDEALYTCFWNTPGGWSVNINTSTKAWQLSPLEVARARNLDDRRYLDFPNDSLDTSFKPGLVRLLVELAKCCSGQDHSLTTISDANRTMKLIDMIYSNDQ